ncbi:MAG: helix-turn-helix transcriptional regulator [Longimicrobiales bacterium]
MATDDLTYVRGAERMVTAVRLSAGGLEVRFADDCEGLVSFDALELGGEPDHVVLPDPYVIEVHLSDGAVEEVPWDFVRHFTDPGYRERSEAAAGRGRRTFGERLRELRDRSGFTQGELAARAGLNRVTIARYETGEQMPRYSTLVALADALGRPVDQLLAA